MNESIALIEKKLKEGYQKLEEGGDALALKLVIDSLVDDSRVGVKKCIEKYERKKQRYEEECERTHNMYGFEREYANFHAVCGVDEVGRGPLAGPVVAAAVILPKTEILYLNDSKKLSERKREELSKVIIEKAISTGIGIVSPARIDEINILQATYEAMRMALGHLQPSPDVSLNDAVRIPGVSCRQVSIVKGDAKSASIAAASILAKVTRDHMMEQYDKILPMYQFGKNKGYGTKEHIEAIQKYGPSPIHRRSFIGNFV